MPMDESESYFQARNALEQLKQHGHRSAVAILLYEPNAEIDWNAVALVHSLGQCDYIARLLAEANLDSRFLNLDADTERDRLSRLAETSNAYTCILVTEFDIALARLNFDERGRLWNNLLHHFPYRHTALLLAVPSGASHLLPDPDAFTLWTDTGKAIPLTYL
jgi:hypothetical protein